MRDPPEDEDLVEVGRDRRRLGPPRRQPEVRRPDGARLGRDAAGTGKTKRVLVIAKPDKAKEALEAGADYAGSDEYIKKIAEENWFEFDTLVATPDMMVQVGKIGRVLGPRGLMPNPKVGTVTADVAKAVAELKAGRVEFRVEKAGIIQTPIGKASFKPEALAANLQALLETLMKLKPATAKGTYMRSITISTTHGPGIKIDTRRVRRRPRVT